MSIRRLAAGLVLALVVQGCALGHFLRYRIHPNPPEVAAGETVALTGLGAPVAVRQTPDGLWHVSATTDLDGMRVLGYLQARDRMFQLDLFRHLAQGRMAEWVGDRPLGDRSALDLDRQNRFLDFPGQARALWAGTDPEQQALIAAFAAGVQAWIDGGHRSLEHRLLGVAVERWDRLDSLTIYAMVMHGLASNANREIRRLLIACDAGLAAMDRIWPTALEPDHHALPHADLRAERYAVAPAVVPEVAVALPRLCPPRANNAAPVLAAAAPPPLLTLAQGWPASNNWVVAGTHTTSGMPVLGSDPHLPMMNPPLLWGFELQTPRERMAGFTIVGLPGLVFGTNGHVAWGQTTNHMDRQDLVLLMPATAMVDGAPVPGYAWEGTALPFDVRRETFRTKGAEAVEATARFTRFGPVYNDLEPMAAARAPLVALRTTGIGAAQDLNAAAAMVRARNVAEFSAAIARIDGDCSNWAIADTAGTIAYRSPCRLPWRRGYSGAFPVAGWLARYDWDGFVPKNELPASTDPARGWLATANDRIVPVDRFPTALHGDPSPSNRALRVGALLAPYVEGSAALHVTASAAIQLDVALVQWPAMRRWWAPAVCGPAAAPGDVPTAAWRAARGALCAWDGVAAAASTAMTVFVHTTHELLDRALADELSGGADGELWRYVQSLLQFEANVQRLWQEPATAAVWDDVRTPSIEGRADVLAAALVAAVVEVVARYGDDPADWAWGTVRPFVLRHMFATNDGLLGGLLNMPPLADSGHITTPNKRHYPRADRQHMNPTVGPVVRMTYDMARPWGATYAFAGGNSGWPRSDHYGDGLASWHAGKQRPLVPPPSAADRWLHFRPAAP